MNPAIMNPQETPTAKLVEIVKQQAESWQKPDEAVWKELLARYGWIGCPREDLVLIGSLDSLLRPLNHGLTMLPPRAILISGGGVPPPPPYYQKKITLSQVLKPPVPTAKAMHPKNADAIPAKIDEKVPSTLEEAFLSFFWKSRFRRLILGAVLLAIAARALFSSLPNEVKNKILKFLDFPI